MGTDRSRIYSGSCECGIGTEEIEFCTPDHGWPVSVPHWYETTVACPKCVEEYKVQKLGKGFYRVSIAELQTKEDQEKKAIETARTIKKKAQEKGVTQELIALLSKQPSVAAIYRMLSQAGLEHHALGTFRKHWSGAESWVNQSCGSHNIIQIMSLLGIEDHELTDLNAQVEFLLAEARKDPVTMGDPVYLLK
jgi:hypothetical protein